MKIRYDDENAADIFVASQVTRLLFMCIYVITLQYLLASPWAIRAIIALDPSFCIRGLQKAISNNLRNLNGPRRLHTTITRKNFQNFNFCMLYSCLQTAEYNRWLLYRNIAFH